MIKPRLFLGSSTEALGVAKSLCRKLDRIAIVTLWRDAFLPGHMTISILQKHAATSDFAVLVATADDILVRRSAPARVPRDNIIFEAGFFMASLGPKRTFIVCDQNRTPKLPSDLAGVTFVPYDGRLSKRASSLDAAVRKISAAVKLQGYSGEVDFLRSYFTLIPPTIRISDSYADIIAAHWTSIRAKLDELKQDRDWRKLLDIKARLREYFEYTGNYREGIEFGHAYVEALDTLRRPFEADWARIKDVAYMNILCGNHRVARPIFDAVVKRHETSTGSARWRQKRVADEANLLFYAYRYRGISYHRDPKGRDLAKARRDYDLARACVERLQGDRRYPELRARILGNYGNLAETEGNFEKAYELHAESLQLFEGHPDGDIEHIGSAHMHLAEALLMNPRSRREHLARAADHLEAAHTRFIELGWVEGIARVSKYFAKYHERLAQRTSSIARRKDLLEVALGYAKKAYLGFSRTKKEREIGKMQAVIDQLAAIA